jgi:hypothetical protein
MTKIKRVNLLKHPIFIWTENMTPFRFTLQVTLGAPFSLYFPMSEQRKTTTSLSGTAISPLIRLREGMEFGGAKKAIH